MSEQSAVTDPKRPTDLKPCTICGSTSHSTANHDGMTPAGHHDGGIAPEKVASVATGHHDGGLAEENFGKKDDQKSAETDETDTGHHDGGSPSK